MEGKNSLTIYFGTSFLHKANKEIAISIVFFLQEMEDWGKDWDMESWDDEVGSWNTKIHIKYKILYRKYKIQKKEIQNTNYKI